MQFTNKELRSILESHEQWGKPNGSEGKRANLSKANLSEADLSEADLIGAGLIGADLSEADLRGADLRGADLIGADLIGADLIGADLVQTVLSDTPSLTSKELFDVLIAHTTSDHYDQSKWCGTPCCLAGAAGQAIGNQSLGIAVIMQVLPDFNTTVLYQAEREVAVAELERVAALYA